MSAIRNRYSIAFLAALLVLTSISCMAVSHLIFDATPAPVANPVPVQPTPTPTPIPTDPPAPSPTPDTCINGDCITACVSQLNPIAQPGSSAVGSIHRVLGGENGYVLVTYNISGDQIENAQDVAGIPQNLKAYQQDSSSQNKIWDYFAAIIPPDQRRFLSEYDVFTDGKDNILASVSQSETDMGLWVLTIDIVDAGNPQDLTYTLVHEFGHLLTLNPSQVIPSQRIFKNPSSEKIYQQEADACHTYFAVEGCSYPDAYINKFFARFWPDIFAEWSKIDAIQNQSRYESELEKFYIKYKDQFVTDYAPTNPEEDIAETFSFFVIKPKPAGNSIADQKVLFFYDFPELVTLRSQIGHRLCAQINP